MSCLLSATVRSKQVKFYGLVKCYRNHIELKTSLSSNIWLYLLNSSFCPRLKFYRFMTSEETFVLKQHFNGCIWKIFQFHLFIHPNKIEKESHARIQSSWMCALIKRKHSTRNKKMHDIEMAESILFSFSFCYAQFWVCHGDPVFTIHIHHNLMANWHQNRVCCNTVWLLPLSDGMMTSKMSHLKITPKSGNEGTKMIAASKYE